MADWFISIVEQLNSTFKTNIISILFVSLGAYFLLVRLYVKNAFDQIILKPKLTGKENDAIVKERLDLIFSGINKRSLGRFWRWLLCRCYPKEQQGRRFKPFVIYSYAYIISTVCCVVLWLAALFVTELRGWSSLSIAVKTLLFDLPLLLVCMFAGIFLVGPRGSNMDKKQRRRLGWIYLALLLLLFCLRIYFAKH